MLEMRIGNIGNYYGGLIIRPGEDNKYKWYWGIENYDDIDWEEIPNYLADALIMFESYRDSNDI